MAIRLPPMHFHITRLVDILESHYMREIVYEGYDHHGVRRILSYTLCPSVPSYRDQLAIFNVSAAKRITRKVAERLINKVVETVMTPDGDLEFAYLSSTVPVEMFDDNCT